MIITVPLPSPSLVDHLIFFPALGKTPNNLPFSPTAFPLHHLKPVSTRSASPSFPSFKTPLDMLPRVKLWRSRVATHSSLCFNILGGQWVSWNKNGYASFLEEVDSRAFLPSNSVFFFLSKTRFYLTQGQRERLYELESWLNCPWPLVPGPQLNFFLGSKFQLSLLLDYVIH